MKKNLFFLLLLAGMCGSAIAYDFSAVAPSGQTLYYNFFNGNRNSNLVVVTGGYYYANMTGNLVIPSTVTYGNRPRTVRWIDAGAFNYCTQLTSVTIPNTVTSIGDGAFGSCYSLNSVNIPNSVTTIGDGCFRYCSMLSSIIIPNSVTSIGWNTFVGCTRLSNVVIPNTVTSIGQNAFADCSGLTNVVIPNTVTSIGYDAFANCSGLTNVVIPNTVTSIESGAFGLVRNLVYDGTATGSPWGALCVNGYIEDSLVFSDSSKTILTGCASNVFDVDIPSSVTSIGPNAFSCCQQLTNVIIPNLVTDIGYYCFQNCSSLRKVTLGSSVETLGNNMFFQCTNLDTIISLRENPIPATTVISSDIINLVKCSSVLLYRQAGWYNVESFEPMPSYQITSPCDTIINVSIDTLPVCPYRALTFSAIPHYGYHFTQWNDGNTDNPRRVILNNDTSFCAQYDSNLYSITVTTNQGSMGYASGSVVKKYLTATTISATPNYGYHFSRWNDGSTANPRTITIIQDKAFSAIFEANSYTVTVHSADSVMGSVLGTSSYPYLLGGSISATPNYGYHFTHWSDGNTDNPRTITLTQDTAFTAVFDSNLYSVTVLTQNNNMGYATGNVSQKYLSSVTINAVPNYGYHFVQWNDGNTSNPRTFTLTRNTEYSAQFDSNTFSISATSENNIMGCVAGSGSQKYLTTVTINAIPNYGYHFAQWNDGNTNNPRIFTLTQDTAISAQFDSNIYTVTVVSGDLSKGTVDGTTSKKYLSSTIISANPLYGYHFVQWDDGNTENPRIVTVSQNKTFTAIFVDNDYAITATSSSAIMGSVSGSGSFPYLENRILTANANYGYHFSQWSDGITDNPRTITLTKDTMFVAQFDYNQYTVTAATCDSIKGAAYGTATVNYLTSVTLTAVPNYGFPFQGWSTGDTSLVITVVADRDKVITAMFDYAMFTITGVSSDESMGSVYGSQTTNYLSSVTLSAVPNYGYHFVRWNTGETTSTISVIADSNKTKYAIFDYNQYSTNCYSEDTIMGIVTGAGVHSYLSNVLISATPNYGYHFSKWSDGCTDNPRSFILTKDTLFTAIFDSNLFAINTTSQDDTKGYAFVMYGEPTRKYLSMVTISATAFSGYHFVSWSDGNTSTPRTFQLTQDTSFVALFDYQQYSIYAISSNEVMGQAYGSTTRNYLSLDTIFAIPNYGYHFTQWNDGNTDNPRIITITNNNTYLAIFDNNSYNILVNSANNIMGSTSGSGYALFNTNRIVSATPNYGYHFTHWSDGDTNNPRTFNLTQDTIFTALFDHNQYTITASTNDSSMGGVSGSTTANYLSSVTLTATPNYGYHFTHWSNGSTSPSIQVTVDENKILTAFFSPNQYTITGQSASQVMGNVVGSSTQNYATVLTLSANPNYGYHFTQWNDGNTDNPRSVSVDSNKTYIAQFDSNIYNVVVTSEDEIMGTVIGNTTQKYLTTVSVNATPNHGYHFVAWTNGLTSNPYTFTLTQDTSLVASFDSNTYIISVASSNLNMGGVSGNGIQKYLTTATITATPNNGYYFTQWSDGNSNNPRTFTLTQDTLFTAYFDSTSYTITVASSNTTQGSVSGSCTQKYLTTAVITATPNYGYHFTQWNDGNTDNPRIITIVESKTYSASFANNNYTITVSSLNDTMGTTSGSGSFEYLSNNTIAAIPNYGYHFTQWSDGITTNPRTFSLTQDTTFIAQFDSNTYNVTATPQDIQMGSVFGSTNQKYLTNVTISAIPYYGYHFVQWSDGDTNNPRTFSITRDTVFIAQFDSNYYQVTVESQDTIMGIVTGNATQKYLTTAVITATPNYGYHFTQWNDGNTDNPRIITLTQDTFLIALFITNTYSVAAGTNNDQWGTVIGGGEYPYLSEVTLTAVPSDHHHIVMWNDGNTDNPRIINLTQDTFLTAIFGIDTLHIDVVPNDITRGSVTGTGDYAYGEMITATATPYSNYSFLKWSDGTTHNPFTFAAVENLLITAIFVPEDSVGITTIHQQPFIINVENGTIIVSNVVNKTIRLFDYTGRCIEVIRASDICKIDVPASGVYLVKVENYPLQKVVVIK